MEPERDRAIAHLHQRMLSRVVWRSSQAGVAVSSAIAVAVHSCSVRNGVVGSAKVDPKITGDHGRLQAGLTAETAVQELDNSTTCLVLAV